MAFLGLFGNDRQMAATTHAGKESAVQKRQSVEAQRSARRRERQHRGATQAGRNGWKWADKEHKRQEGQ